MLSNLSNNEISRIESPNAPVGEEARNWLELPCDLMLMILVKVGAFDILEFVQFVCKVWYNLCKEPDLWRTIHIRNAFVDDPDMSVECENMMFIAVNRSAGGLIDLSIDGFGYDMLLSYVISQSSQLKRLRLANCNEISENVLIEALKKLSSLEELELILCNFIENGEAVVSAINSCLRLTTFKFNNIGTSKYWESDEEALAIAASMPQLCHLQLIGNNITNVGLTAILDACPRLQSLDLRACYNLDLEGDLGKRLSEEIKNLRHPDDSTQDYKYPTPIDHWFDDFYDCWQIWQQYFSVDEDFGIELSDD